MNFSDDGRLVFAVFFFRGGILLLLTKVFSLYNVWNFKLFLFEVVNFLFLFLAEGNDPVGWFQIYFVSISFSWFESLN